MQRMTRISSTYPFIQVSRMLLAVAAIVSASLIGLPTAQGQMGGVFQADYRASGYVTPAGMVPPEVYARSFAGGTMPGGVIPVGYWSGSPCDAAPCDGGCDGGCDSACSSSGGCGVGGTQCAGGGLFGPAGSHEGVRGGGGIFANGCPCGSSLCSGCGSGGCNLSNLRHLCIFCRGQGCSACQLWNNHGASCFAFLTYFLPHTEAGICAMRWYDASVEAVWLNHTTGAASFPVTSLGVDGPRVLSLGDAGVSEEAGVRVSTAMIFGAGGNLEFTYMGGQEWRGNAQATDPNAQLFSFISEFGQNPLSGFDDTDRSLVQSVSLQSSLHSGELNYRRRTMWPYCRFQGSWLAGLRYLRYDDTLIYATRGQNDNTVNANLPRFFASEDTIKNTLFGGQIGADIWWNVVPGISVGAGAKGAWVQNDIRRGTLLTANSLIQGQPGTARIESTRYRGTVFGDFEAKAIYRMSHSFTLKTAYYWIVLNNVGFGGVDNNTIQDFLNQSTTVSQPVLLFDDLVIQGGSIGLEFMW